MSESSNYSRSDGSDNDESTDSEEYCDEAELKITAGYSDDDVDEFGSKIKRKAKKKNDQESDEFSETEDTLSNSVEIKDDDMYDEKTYDDPEEFYSTAADDNSKAGKLAGIFEGFFEEKESNIELRITAAQQKAFLKKNYDEISKTVAELGITSRIALRDALESDKIKLLEIFNREENFNVRTTFIGLFSDPCVFHAIVIRHAIKKKDFIEVARVFALKTAEMIFRIKTHYQDIFGILLEADLSSFQEGDLLIKMSTKKKYYAEIPSSAFEVESARIFELIKNRKATAIANFTQCFSHRSFKGVCSHFYSKYGYTICEHMFTSGISISTCNLIKVFHDALISPRSFYCHMIREKIRSKSNDIFLPYLVIFLHENGLGSVLKHYKDLYQDVEISRIVGPFDNPVRNLLTHILKRDL